MIFRAGDTEHRNHGCVTCFVFVTINMCKMLVVCNILYVCVFACVHVYRDNYKSDIGQIATQKWGWPVKFYSCGQNKILIEKIICIIRTMAVLEVMITLYPTVVVKSG